MDFGIGLPVCDPAILLDWARRAEAGPFSTLGLLDRLAYHNPEPLVALAMLAGATARIRIQTEVLLAPLRDTALLAKQAATVDRMTGGRLVLGLGVGSRDDDYQAAGVDAHTRGQRLDEQMAVMRRIWSGKPYSDRIGPIGPAPARTGGPAVLFGGFKPAALERVARWGDGFLAAAEPSWAGPMFDTVRTFWKQYGREGEPRIIGQVSIALGPEDVIDAAHAAIDAYYAFEDGLADQMSAALVTTPAGIRDAITGFTDLGADQVMFYCWATDPTQVDRLADIL
jgi:alkanesulfonate monooxygenase SsuD/methylene tetrahydromethanopterin reductase-like flavin-dependent oxidoreductase (luciferase family)